MRNFSQSSERPKSEIKTQSTPRKNKDLEYEGNGKGFENSLRDGDSRAQRSSSHIRPRLTELKRKDKLPVFPRKKASPPKIEHRLGYEHSAKIRYKSVGVFHKKRGIKRPREYKLIESSIRKS